MGRNAGVQVIATPGLWDIKLYFARKVLRIPNLSCPFFWKTYSIPLGFVVQVLSTKLTLGTISSTLELLGVQTSSGDNSTVDSISKHLLLETRNSKFYDQPIPELMIAITLFALRYHKIMNQGWSSWSWASDFYLAYRCIYAFSYEVCSTLSYSFFISFNSPQTLTWRLGKSFSSLNVFFNYPCYSSITASPVQLPTRLASIPGKYKNYRHNL